MQSKPLRADEPEACEPDWLRSRVAPVAAVYGPALLFLGMTLIAHLYKDISFRFFTADPTATLGGHPLTGVQSVLGVLIWSATGAISLFTYTVLRRGQGSSFFLWSGVIVTVLALDDCFLFHDFLAPRYLKINQNIVYGFYAVAVACYLASFRRRILDSRFCLLLMCLLFLSLSVVIDIFQDRWLSPWRIFFEDGFKFLGIVGWSGYLVRTSLDAIGASLSVKVATLP